MALGNAPLNERAVNGTGVLLGTASLVLRLQVQWPTGAATLPFRQQVITPTGTSRLPLRLITAAAGTASLPLTLQVQLPTGAARLPLRQRVETTGSAQAGLSIVTLDAANRAERWRVAVYLDGVDVSARLTGSVRVEAEEDTARIAECTLRPASGPASLFDYLGARLDIDYVPVSAAGVALGAVPLFRGRCAEPQIDPRSGVVHLQASDGRQTLLEALTREAIDAITPGGAYSALVDDPEATGADYAALRMGSLPASLDLDIGGGWRLTPWEAGVLRATLTEADCVDGSLAISLAPRDSLVNAVELAIEYRYRRDLERRRVLRWQEPWNFCQGLHYTNPNDSMIEQAIEGTGWRIVAAPSYTRLPPSGWVFCGTQAIAWINNQTGVATGFSAEVAKRYSRQVAETYTLRVEAPASITRFAELLRRGRAGISADTETPWGDDVTVPSWDGQDGADYYLDRHNDVGRAGVDDAIAALIARARVTILASHRAHSVRCQIPLAPNLGRTDRVRLQTATLTAEGKVRQVIHTLDLGSGQALTELQLAVSQGGGSTDDAVVAPAPPATTGAAETPPRITLTSRYGQTAGAAAYNPAWTGFTGNRVPPESLDAPTYPERFRISMPEITRDPVQADTTAAYAVAIPEDPMTLTIEELPAWP